MTELELNIRNNTIGCLELLSSLKEQLAYEEDVPIAHVPAELFCTWFDDLGYGRITVSRYAGSFTVEELIHLENFNRFFQRDIQGHRAAPFICDRVTQT